ncbi:orotidine-5'-phosphate decarboxylase [Pseudoalteromonas ruthenica]|uniref:Orotidine 5'-phosphate decarboxylase n=1 Tax=Pseudoalteromonas ruthenica TaxID=151081 RepID=A0A5S3Z8S3_9GAMM|nr:MULTISPECIES: orotidine-5'-phosphate decarboxylase [Pseudoalteromonas]MCF2861713.1 orotidine-5'-phosphate decarboxylase [Pseudoalteromonas sp. CNAT2-18]MCG7557249.1 orotidine-5'-phosphate decarboxylase [Pseudoalteromonas sp. CNAT2-18.1]MCG7568838.1 orotidine-5'-phosphate decarboxylase [Pseudoalteromonas sp. CNC9-20]TMP88265.1 orotidine-5'-phosphate decarboxylase [Pseudoalteromonas ruthenica]GAP76402.1 orotidine 5'-phosphate decarboxylase [Pseudoalteromonas sp. SW0106-04]
MSSVDSKKVLIALDYDDQDKALAFVKQLSPSTCRLKVGKEMFTLFGPDFVKQLVDLGFDVFLDLKFHDIPNTVAKAVTAAAKLGVWMVNVHASGGVAMMEKAKAALTPFGDKAPLLIAVTVLTSMDEIQLKQLGIDKSPQEQVLYLAKLAQQAGLDGVVCSAQEAQLLKSQLGSEFTLVTPGIRPAGSDAGDQKRIMTPERAVASGSDYLVIGRPITQAADPVAVLTEINESLGD